MRSRFFRSIGPAVTGCSLIACALAITPHASGQAISFATNVGFGPGGDGLNAPIGKSDLELMTSILSLTGDQKAAATVLLDAYLAEHGKRADVVRTAQENARAAFREDRDPSVFQEMSAKYEAFAKENAAKERELLENIKSLLDKQQTEQWPLWERAHRRATLLNRGMMSGERADLVQIVDRLKLPAATVTSLAPTLDAYAIEIDRALVTRDDAQKAAAEENKGVRDMLGKGADMQEMMKKVDEMLKKSREASIPVRDCNRKYARQIEAALAGINAADAQRFATAFRKASFPDVYRERYADRAIAAAEKLEGLTKSQAEGVGALKEQYVRDRAPLEQAAEKAAEEAEASFSLSGGNFMRFGGDEASLANRKARRELDDATLDKLKTILGPDLAAQLPDRSKDNAAQEPFGIMGGGGGAVRVIAPGR